MATKKAFDFKLGDTVKASLTAETGKIIGRAHYLRAEPSYLVEYVRADGVQSEAWWDEDALVAAGNTKVSEDA